MWCTIRDVLSTNGGVVWYAFKATCPLTVGNQPQTCHPNPCYVEEELEYFDVVEEDYNTKKEDEYIERVCIVNYDSPPIYDNYPENYSQGGKIGLDENKIIYTHTHEVPS